MYNLDVVFMWQILRVKGIKSVELMSYYFLISNMQIKSFGIVLKFWYLMKLNNQSLESI